jgi:hypothetical protein
MPIFGNAGAPPSLLSVTVSLSVAQLALLASSPVTLVPAPGAGKMIFPTYYIYSTGNADATFAYSPTYNPGFTFGASGVTFGSAPSGPAFAIFPIVNSVQGADAESYFSPVVALENQPLIFTNAVVFVRDPGVWGAIGGAAVNAGGSGYATGDTGTLTFSGADSGDAFYIVQTVDGSGAVTSFTLSSVGTSYTTRTGVSSVAGGSQPGAGVGFTADLTVPIAQTAAMSVTVYYDIVDVVP